MLQFKELTQINGFDIKCPKNAIQNSYAWSMAELGDYIYVGTSRNMMSSISASFGQNNTTPPPFIITGNDNNAEIWRYKKDGTLKWQKVLKVNPSDNIYGFRIMITHQSFNDYALYAAGIGKDISLFKSTDGIHWLKLNTCNLVGTSSRALASYNGRLYIATLEEGIGGSTPHLYSSCDPEFEPFKSVINKDYCNFMPDKNPSGGIDDLQVFNGRLYLGIDTENGAEIWKSDNINPHTNDWTLVADKGFGDAANRNVMSSCVFKDHLYIAVTKLIPLSYFAPFGFDLIRIDKLDNWEVVVGGKPLIATSSLTGKRRKSLSCFNSGFNNFFNIYGWQLKEFKDKLILTTCDSSIIVKTIYDAFVYNKEQYISNLGLENYCTIIKSYKKILHLLKLYKYQMGFDIYVSEDGYNFRPVVLNGLNNQFNYGGRKLLVSCENKLYIGTANPYQGCEVWKADFINSIDNISDHELCSYFSNLRKLNYKLIKIYPDLLKALETMLAL